MNRTVAGLRILWCRMTGRHKGVVDYTYKTGPYWMCDHCGEVVR
jgi:hypothetical protein